MWNRKELKKKGKIAFKKNYWKCVLVGIILMIFVGTNGNQFSTEFNINGTDDSTSDIYYEDVDSFIEDEETISLIEDGYYIVGDTTTTNTSVINNTSLTFHGIPVGYILSFGIGGGIVVLLISIFISNPLEVSGNKYFIDNANENCDLNNILFAFKGKHYLNIVAVQLIKNVFIFLWTLALIIPGIIKMYEYRMVSYILCDHPEMDYKEALKLSKEMMKGNKFDAFILDLSFIGWNLLSAITLGIAGIFYVNPYIYATDTELYLALKQLD